MDSQANFSYHSPIEKYLLGALAMSKLWMLVISSFLVSVSAQAGMSAEELMQATAEVAIENGLHLQMPTCAEVEVPTELLDCVISQGWGDFNSESYDSAHGYEEVMYVVYFQEKSKHSNRCYVEVAVDASVKKVISSKLKWTCL